VSSQNDYYISKRSPITAYTGLQLRTRSADSQMRLTADVVLVPPAVCACKNGPVMHSTSGQQQSI
jgi:hypothetical protein